MDKKVEDILSLYKPSELVFWIGAGVDADQPTNLPIGNALGSFVLEHVFNNKMNGDDVEKIFQNKMYRFEKFFHYMNDLYYCGFPESVTGIRLETILSNINNFEKNAEKNHKGSYIDGFRSFAEALPNSAHYALAAMLHEGATLITANYDTCIQTAYQDRYNSGMVETKLGNQIYKFVPDDGGGILYYFHGIATHTKSLGITLDTIDNPFEGVFLDAVTNKYNGHCCFVFLGYGCVDDFDVNPLFRQLYDKKSDSDTSYAICVLYPDGRDQQTPTFKQMQMLRTFANYTWETARLPEFFRRHFGGILADRYVTNVCTEDGWWKKYFVKPPQELVDSMNSMLDFSLGTNRKINGRISSTALQDWFNRFYTIARIRKKFRFSFNFDWTNNHKVYVSVNQAIQLLNMPIGRDEKNRINWKPVSAINHRCKDLVSQYSLDKKICSAADVSKLYISIDDILDKYSMNQFSEPREKMVLQYDLAMLMLIKQYPWRDISNQIIQGISLYLATSESEGVENGISLYVKILGLKLKYRDGDIDNSSELLNIDKSEYKKIKIMAKECRR